jgi:hypothetical protein
VTQHYGLAISSLRQISEQADANMPTILMCCFLFVLIESLRGNYDQAKCHLLSGTNIIVSAASATGTLPSLALRTVATMFQAVASQVSVVSDNFLLPDLRPLAVPMKKYSSPSQGLRDLDEAEEVLNALDDMLSGMWSDHIGEWDGDLYDEDDDFEAVTEEQWTLLDTLHRQWKIGFEDLLGRIARNPQEAQASEKRILKLKNQGRLWELWLIEDCPRTIWSALSSSAPSPRLSVPQANQILDELEVLWKDSAEHPSFGLKCDFVTSFFQMYHFCHDSTVRRRVIALLRSRRRMEIFWDSFQLADILEDNLARRELGLKTPRWPEIGPYSKDKTLLVLRPAPTSQTA